MKRIREFMFMINRISSLEFLKLKLFVSFKCKQLEIISLGAKFSTKKIGNQKILF